MSWCNTKNYNKISLLVVCMMMMSIKACDLRPLNQTISDVSDAGKSQVNDVLASMHVEPVEDRVAQQVRNELIFALQGGNKPENILYVIEINAVSEAQEHSAIAGVRAPTSAQVKVSVAYRIKDKATKKIIAQGERAAITGYDLTPQNFANQRARRDAENRAAKTVARQIHLAIAQQVAG